VRLVNSRSLGRIHICADVVWGALGRDLPMVLCVEAGERSGFGCDRGRSHVSASGLSR
jgi:hypothetical protein